jgi:hypothetical protein
MNKELLDYINEPRNSRYNFNLGYWYEKQNHISPAVSFYIRSAEYTDDINIRYEALIRVFFCYDKAGGRDQTSETTLRQAITLCPKRAEAYFLLAQFYEYKQKWIDAYTFASLALEFVDKNHEVMADTNYPGFHVFYFLKACSAWHIGKPNESRKLYRFILDNCVSKLDDSYKAILQNNLSRLGVGSEKVAIRKYRKSTHKLKFSFDYLDQIEENHSQAYQDICALIMNEGKPGTYLEIGAAHPFTVNNTALLENFGWKGIGLEIDDVLIQKYSQFRQNKVIKQDALNCDYEKLILEILGFGNKDYIDYLQVDVEPPKNTFLALASLPFEKYKFKFITYEHDYYTDVSRLYREKSRKFLQSYGYQLLINDVSPIYDCNFEDWWYHPDLVNKEVVDILTHVDLNTIHNIEHVFLIDGV